MQRATNNNYDLEHITVNTPGPFAVGETLPGRAAFRDWLVRRRDETTLLIAPIEKPEAWEPTRIYGVGGIIDEFWDFRLVPIKPRPG